MDKPNGIGMRPAIFLDRDGTVIEHVHLLTHPSQVRLIPGAADAIRNLQSLDYACIIVTNQSVIGRGLLSESGLGMLQKAAREMLLDLSRSWIIGDMHSDMLAGRNAGLRGTILVRTGQGDTVDHQDPAVDHVATDLLEASRLIARLEIPLTVKSK